MPLAPQIILQAFDKQNVDFVGSINPPGKNTSLSYIINTIDYLNRWDETTPVKDCTAPTVVNFLLENVVTRFGFSKILLIDQGTHFVSKIIAELTTKFHVQHKKTTPYHPQENGTVESFNNILENALTKVCNMRRDDWDQKVSAVLWAYHTTFKRLIGHTPFKLVY